MHSAPLQWLASWFTSPVLFGGLLLAVMPTHSPAQQSRGQNANAATPQAWTLNEALQQLQYSPHDAYLQYIVLQLAEGSPQADMAVNTVRQLQGRLRRRQRRPEVEAFGLFSGALAIQESLQLERLSGGEAALPFAGGDDTVSIAELQGPTIQSHPWREMLGQRRPDVSRLSQSVPEDFFFVEARTLTKLLELADLGDLWGRHLSTQAVGQARTQLAIPRVLDQLAVQRDDVLRAFYDSIVGRIAVTGSDLFLREGSDVTLLFDVKQSVAFRARMELFLTQAQSTHPEATRSTGTHLDVDYVHLTTPDRTVHVYSAYPREDLHVRSNSLVALRRVIETIRGRDAQDRAVASLGDSDEFHYMRTLMPLGDESEDVLVYLSDPFIRRLVGPQLKLTELRRMYCYNHLRMIGHAGLLHQTQQGRAARSLTELVQSGCAPNDFLNGGLHCPEGGTYGLQSDGLGGVCSHHGHAALLKPCCEIPVDAVSDREAQAYRQFLSQYNSFWRRFFDPIAIRIQLAPDQYRVETIILPLIDNSIYTALARTLGGQPQPLETTRVPERNIFTAAIQLDKAALAQQFGLREFLTPQQRDASRDTAAAAATQSVQNLRRIAVAMFNYHDTFQSFPPARSRRGRPVNAQLSWRVHLLPYLGEQEQALYHEFRLDEPWDSPHNRKLVDRIPDSYRPDDTQLAAVGKTRFVLPTGEKTITPKIGQSVRIAQVTDGLSNTVLIVEADREHAVVWTQPADLNVDLQKPLDGIAFGPQDAMLAAMADGRIVRIRRAAAEQKLADLLTRSGGETTSLETADQIAVRVPSQRRRSPFPEEFDRQQAARFLLDGIGDRITMHLYDSDPLLSVSLPRLLGELMRDLSLGGIDDDFVVIGALLASITAPTYVELPVKDADIVDGFLERLETLVAQKSREPGSGGFLDVRQDFYRWTLREDIPAWSFVVTLGPIKARIYWARIGDTLCISSKRYVFDDLLDAKPLVLTARERETTSGHAMLRLRPQHWDAVLSSFQLGWSEGHRQACHDGLGALGNLSRAATAVNGRSDPDSLARLAERVYDAHFYCPEGGRFEIGDEGKHVQCSVHGSGAAPRQPTHLGGQSAFAQLLEELGPVTLTLAFLEDGLRAVVTIERQSR